jgi:hypothetical protein
MRPSGSYAILSKSVADCLWADSSQSRYFGCSGWCSNGSNDRIRIYRRRNERLFSSCVQEMDSFGGDSVMVWAAISNDRKTDLVHVPGNWTAVRYRDEILSAPTRHSLNQFFHFVSWYCSPFLLQHLVELIEGLRWRLSLEHTFIQLIP